MSIILFEQVRIATLLATYKRALRTEEGVGSASMVALRAVSFLWS